MEKVLIVDDNEQNCELMRDLLSAWGYEVLEAFQGMDAIRYALNESPDIILLDVMLPGMNGFEVCHEIKTNPQTQNIPVIMLTVLNDVEDRIRGLKVGADHFLSKPINYNELKYRISALVGQKKHIDAMESRQQVAESFLALMRLKNPALYQHSCRVHEYCDKIARLLFVAEEQRERLLLGAYLHDVGKLADDSLGGHLEAGIQIIMPLKMGEWLTALVRNHHQAVAGAEPVAVELEILATVNQFINLCSKTPDKESCSILLREEARHGRCSIRVVEALEQLLRDEKFIKNLAGQVK